YISLIEFRIHPTLWGGLFNERYSHRHTNGHSCIAPTRASAGNFGGLGSDLGQGLGGWKPVTGAGYHGVADC
ncbi:MAG TPA: hypothetical protein PL064_07495, partial [Thermogutta sp.]|nr:hypothetical protein [Thermogutta sp.]